MAFVRTWMEVVVDGITTITDVESVSVSMNRGMQVGTASFYLPRTIATVAGDLAWHGKSVKIYACSQGSSSTRLQVFEGTIVEREKRIDAKTLTHYGWTFRAEDYVSVWEAQDFDISLYDDAGFSTDMIAELIEDAGMPNFTRAPAVTIRQFDYTGNGIGLIRAYMEQCGKSQYGGSGSFVGNNFVESTNGVSVTEEVFSVPEANGIKIYNKNNAATFEPTPGTARNFFFTARESWWIPASWMEMGDSYPVLHVIFAVQIKHPKVTINEDMDDIYEALYFGDEEQTFTEMKASDLFDETELKNFADYDPITLIKPRTDDVFTTMYIHKEFDQDSEEPNAALGALVWQLYDEPEQTGHVINALLKELLPTVVTLHIATTNVWDFEEYTEGTLPYIEMEKHVSPDVLEAVAECEYNEMQSTDYTRYRYGLSLVSGVPIPDHGTDGTAGFFMDGGTTDYFIESVSIDWSSGNDVVVNALVRQPSTAVAEYRRISEFSMMRQFKEVVQTTFETLDDAVWVKQEGGAMRFHFNDGTETLVSLSEINMQDNGIIRVKR